MALFRYKALSTTGESLDGQMEAANTDAIVKGLTGGRHGCPS